MVIYREFQVQCTVFMFVNVVHGTKTASKVYCMVMVCVELSTPSNMIVLTQYICIVTTDLTHNNIYRYSACSAYQYERLVYTIVLLS